MSTMRPKAAQQGFGLVAALFVIVIIAGVIAAMARMAVTQNATTSLAIQQARAYQAARAGLEWGINRTVNLQACNGNFTLNDFVINVICTLDPNSPVTVPEESTTPVSFYSITATAEYGSAGSPDYAYRQLTATGER